MTYNELEIISEAFEVDSALQEALDAFSSKLVEYTDDDSFLCTFNYEFNFTDKFMLLCEWTLEYFSRNKEWELIHVDTYLVYHGGEKQKRISVECYDEVESVAVNCMDYIISPPDDPWYDGTFNKNIY